MDYLTTLVWQDVVLTFGQSFFVFALLPMLKAKDKPPLSTSVAHGLILGTFGFTFITLDLFFSALSVSIVSIMWFYLAWQRYKQAKF